MSESFTYEAIREHAKQLGKRVEDLLVLARQNDPFYTGTPSDLTAGKWFFELWTRFGYTKGVHLRRIHYQIVSQQEPVTLPSGKPYENTEADWIFMSNASKAARYLGLVDPAFFDDRRNPDAVINDHSEHADLELHVVEPNSWSLPELPDFPEMPEYELTGYRGERRYQIEVWAEKSTMNDILIPLCKRYGANLQTGLGELSITATLKLVSRIQKSTRIFYVSDFDPAGQSMPVAVARKIEFFLRSMNGNRPPHDVRLHPVVLTLDQVKEYRLPRTPIKQTEKRAGKFEERYGEGAVELDALEALHPGELARILCREMDRYYDHDLTDKVRSAKSVLLNDLESTRDRVLSLHRSDIEHLQREYQAIRAEFAPRIQAYRRELVALIDRVSADLIGLAPDLAGYPIPQADHAEEPADLLFDSSRDYFEQLTSYRKFQGRGDGGDAAKINGRSKEKREDERKNNVS